MLTRCLDQGYLDKRHSDDDAQDHPDVGEEPVLHAGGTALLPTQTWLTTEEAGRAAGHVTRKCSHLLVDGPAVSVGLAEAAVGDVPGGEGDVLTGAGKQLLAAGADDSVTEPVLVVPPPAAPHL